MTYALLEIGRLLANQGPAAARIGQRLSLDAESFSTRELPGDILLPDGALDLYQGVREMIQPTFAGGKLSVQCGKWLGYIPLNDRYALNVSSRVDIGNLERLIAMAGGDPVKVLPKHTRHFGLSDDVADSLYDLLADQLIEAFDRLWSEGLVREYVRRTRESSFPSGRILLFESARLTAVRGRPVAISSSFERTPDTGPNRLLLAAFLKLVGHYRGAVDLKPRRRLAAARRNVERLEGVGRLRREDITPAAMARNFARLSAHHEHYADALRTARIIADDMGIAVRDTEGIALLPSVLIDMSTVFEGYLRRILSDGLRPDDDIAVMDGNKKPPVGAGRDLYSDLDLPRKSPPVSPDIVVQRGGEPLVIIDAKYKSAPKSLPDRHEVEQVVVYGDVYRTTRVMLFYADRTPDQPRIRKIGAVGDREVFIGCIDLNATDIAAEEAALVRDFGPLLA